MATPEQIKQSGHDDGRKDERARELGRRAYVRYPVVLDATLIDPRGGTVPCVMRDFCVGGMLLHYKPTSAERRPNSIVSDDVFIVHCLVPDAQDGRLLEFQARVVRIVQDGVGLAFINPVQESLQAVQRFAVQYSSDANKRRAERISELRKLNRNAGTLGRRYPDIIAGCSEVVRETMDALLARISDDVADHLFDLSRDARDIQDQNDLFGGAEDLRENKESFVAGVRASFNERLDEKVRASLKHSQPREQSLDDFSLDKMSLIGDEDLGAWLAISDITTKVEEKSKESLATLEERLSVVFGMNINHVNNPFGPSLFAESFQSQLAKFNFKESVNVVCYTALREALVPVLTHLYEKLNDVLINHGILPKLKYRFAGHGAPEHKAGGGEGQSLTSEHVTQARAAEIDGATNRDHGSPVSMPPGGRDDGEGRASVHQADGEEGARIDYGKSSDLYRLVQNLRDLSQELSSRKVYAASAAAKRMPEEANWQRGRSADALPCYSTDEVVDVVTDLQVEPVLRESEGDQGGPVKSRVLAALEARNGDGNGKAISPRDDNVLEVAGDLLSAVQNDPLVAKDVKPWLKQLELPVLKLALQDPSLFFDQTHIVRQVMNSIAQLEFYHPDGATIGQTSIGAAIEALLEKISLERSDGLEIFAEIQAKLDKLVRIQNLAYAENLQDVVKACEEAAPVSEVYELEAIGDDHIDEAEMRKWMMFAQRLRAGDEVLFSSWESVPQRLRVAWVDDDRTLYVFVNLRGLKEKVMKAADVARMIRLGIMQPQGNAADPAMDRAQYTVMQDLYKQVVYESTHDSLTGLINRREFSRHLGRSLDDAQHHDHRHVLMLVDIDQFGAINSSCGYGGGDQLLQDVTKILGADLEDKGEIARVGADEFAILLSECTLDDALAIAEQQIEDVANYKLLWNDHQFSVTVSVGVVPISARSGSVDALMQAVESSCSIAKDAGGNRLQLFHAGYSRVSYQAEVKKWAAKVDKVLEEGGLEIRCQRIQPILGDGSLRPHYEILLGVINEDGNVGSPEEFIKGAELGNKMSTVDRYVISTTLAWMNANAELIENFAGFTINLSGESLNEEGFVDFILEQLQGARVPYEKICFEITETVGIANLSDTTLMIDRIKDTGCRFALDDFGSGMSSYGYLKNLPVDVVKIDGAFVKELVADSSDYAVVKSITEIAHFMKKKVVAEFVETDEILNLLREIGVDYVQGYMIDKPGSLDRLANESFTPGA